MKKYRLIPAILFFFFANFAIAQTSVNVTMSGSGITQTGSGYEACMTSANGSMTLTANVINPPSGTLNFDWYDENGFMGNTGSSNTYNVSNYNHGSHHYHVKVTTGGSSPTSNTSLNVQLDAYYNYNGVQENQNNQSVILNPTDASYSLIQLLKSSTINGADIVFTTVNPLYSAAIISNNQFDPSAVPPGSYDIQCTVTDNGHCSNFYPLTAHIVILDPQATLPSFLKGYDALPVCENKTSFGLFAYIQKADMGYSGFPPSFINISITDKNGTHNVQGILYAFDALSNPIYYFNVDPSQHIVNTYSLQFKILSVLAAKQTFYTGYIPIFPRRNPFLLGLPTPVAGQINLCSASNDTIFMRGTPASPISYGSYNYYSGIPVVPPTNPATYVFTKIPNATISATAPPNDPSLQKFVPAEIFKNQLGSDINNVFKIVYTYPANASGSCPDSITNIVNFQSHTNTSFVIADPAARPYCYGEPFTLNVINNAVGDKYTWDFGDGVSTSIDSVLTYKHLYGKAGSFNLRFKTFAKVLPPNLCNNDTIVSVKIGAKPVANFDVFNNFEGQVSTLKGLSKIPVANISSAKDTIIKWYWDFGVNATTKDTNRAENNVLTRSNDTTFTYLATQKNPYRVVHTVVTEWGCMDSLVRNIPVFPIDTPLTATNVFETFDNPSTANGWFQSGQYLLDPNNKESSWDNVIPNKNIIKSADPCWITVKAKSINQDTSGYYNNEFSYVESPCYSLSQLALPMVSLNTWTQSDNLFDGATFQYTLCDSAFGKEKWETIGKIGQGLEWFNSKTIISSPGGKPAAGINLQGWTGTDNITGWKLSAYRINNLKDSLQKYPQVKYVRFRIAFSSNGDNTPGKIFDGFAFDNFFVGQRNRKVVTEEFCDYKNYEIPFQGNPLDPQIVRLQYHVKNQNPDDQINNQNTADPSARALLYGIDVIPRAVIDGVGFKNNTFYPASSDPQGGWGSDAFFIRSLQLSPFNISLSHTISNNNNVSVNANIVQNAASSSFNPNASLVAQIVVLEDTVMSNGKLFTNVVRNMVPDASGHHLGKWSGVQQSVSGVWKPSVKPQSGLKIVVFVQDEETKEIYQASIDSINKSVAVLFSVGRTASAFNPDVLDDFNLYPNPTSGDLTISFNHALLENASWKVTDVYGIQVLSGSIASGSNNASLTASGLTNGVYHIQIENSAQKTSKTFTVIR